MSSKDPKGNRGRKGQTPVDPPAPPELPAPQNEADRLVGVLLDSKADTARVLEILEMMEEADLLQVVEVKLIGMGESALADMVNTRRKSILRGAAEAAGPQLEVLDEYDGSLPCKLTRQEIENFSRQSLELYKKVDDDIDLLKQQMSDKKAAIKQVKAEADTYRRHGITGVQHRMVKVVKYWDANSSQVVEIRTDTNEEIARRKPTSAESQTVLFKQTR